MLATTGRGRLRHGHKRPQNVATTSWGLEGGMRAVPIACIPSQRLSFAKGVMHGLARMRV